MHESELLQHNLGDTSALVVTTMYLIRWQNNTLPARLLQRHTGEHHCGVPLKNQEKGNDDQKGKTSGAF